MTHEEIEKKRRELQDILEEHANKLKEHENKAVNDDETRNRLRDLAKQVGASTQAVFLNVTYGGSRKVDEAEICELAYNIHHALQTASMIDACRTAAKNHEIAMKAHEIAAQAQESARHSRWISVAVMLAAAASAAAAWVAAMRPWLANAV
jgi:hypothetical protein